MERNEYIDYIIQHTNKLKNNEINVATYWSELKYLDLPISDEIIIVQYNGLGDGLLCSGFIKIVKLNNPNKPVILICNASFKNLYEYCLYIDKLISVPCKEQSFADILFDIINICKENFWYTKPELILCPQWGRPNFMASITANLVGGNRRIGYNLNSWKTCYVNPPKFYNDPINYDFLLTDNLYSPDNIIHNIDRKIYILKYLGYKVDSYDLDIQLIDTDYFKINFLKQYPYKIAIGLGGSLKSKCYPSHLLIQALEKIIKIDKPEFVFIGGNDCINDADFIISTLNNGINLCGKLTLRESLAAMQQCQLYIGNDTVTSHMASVYNLPIINIVMEAKDKYNDCPGHLSSVQQFSPRSKIVKIIQPEYSLNQCQIAHIHGGCMFDIPHCITQINPLKIVEAYKEIRKEM